MPRRHLTWVAPTIAVLLLAASPSGATQVAQGTQEPDLRGASFLADKYEVSAYIDTVAQGINAIAKVQFRAQEVSQTVRVELHENLEVREIKGADGKQLTFQRENVNPMYIDITLPTPIAAGPAVS